MEFFKYTINWFKGESFEGGMILLWGLLLIVMSAYFWKFGHSSTIRIMIIPFLVVGLFWGLAGGAGLYINSYRVEKYQIEYDKNQTVFIENEKKRVEGFFKWYPYLLAGWSVLILFGLALFMIWGGNLGRAIGLAVILFAVPGLLVDHTSENNARSYYFEIKKCIEAYEQNDS